MPDRVLQMARGIRLSMISARARCVELASATDKSTFTRSCRPSITAMAAITWSCHLFTAGMAATAAGIAATAVGCATNVKTLQRGCRITAAAAHAI
ncbi:MAG: hypothetical protein H0X45_11100 [Planctomycetes bacterium]|nr:hypothetical protein [Planctomycetota bacterium]